MHLSVTYAYLAAHDYLHPHHIVSEGWVIFGIIALTLITLKISFFRGELIISFIIAILICTHHEKMNIKPHYLSSVKTTSFVYKIILIVLAVIITIINLVHLVRELRN